MSVEPFQSSIGACVAGAPVSAECRTFLNNQLSSIQNNQVAFKNDTFNTALTNAKQDFDAVIATSALQSRTQEAANLATSQSTNDSKIVNMYTHDVDVSKRQFQINEYQYNNKLEFLFFLQLLFISVLVMAILVYLNKNGTLTTQMTAISTMVLALVVVIVGVSRYFYTRRTRDRHLWNRRYFANEKAPGADLFPSTCGGPTSATTINLDALVDPRTTQCAIESSDAFKRLEEAAQAEVISQMAGTSANSLWSSSLTLGPSSSCKR
jgi:hypothetical protein